MSSRRNEKRCIGWLGRWLAAAGFGLAIATFAAAEPRAELLSPVVSRPYVPRASSEEIPPGGDPAVTKFKQRGGEFQFPPTYSSGKSSREFPEITGLWNRFVRVFRSDDAKKPPVQPAPKESLKSTGSPPQPKEVLKPTVTMPQPVRTAPQPVAANPVQIIETGSATVPAWKWYGYGAPTPGSNTLAPTGRYGAVQPAWYSQTGATPGAIPRISETVQGPVLPLPPVTPSEAANPPPDHPPFDRVSLPEQGPRLEMRQPLNATRQADLQIPGNVSPSDTVKPARIEMPSRPRPSESDSSYTPILPVSARHPQPVSRAQAPDATMVPSALVAALKSACTGYVTEIDIRPIGPRSIAMRFTLIAGILPDRLADRIARLSELDGWNFEMKFTR